jgi:hypothetical protein
MAIRIRINEFSDNGKVGRDYDVSGPQEYRHEAMPALARLSVAVERQMDYYRRREIQDRVARIHRNAEGEL